MLPNLISRFSQSHAHQVLSDTPVLGLVGPRQSGKTTLALQIGGQIGGIKRQYLTLDDPNQLAAARYDPLGFIRRLDFATIDEIQRAPELMLAIKQSVDADRRPGRFIVTGSANILTARGIQDSMAGRIETVQLLPFSQDEIRANGPAHFLDWLFAKAGLNDIGLQNVTKKLENSNDQVQRADFVPLIVQGGYPEVLTRPQVRRRRDWFNAYIAAVTQKDLPDIATIDNAADMPRFVQLLALLNGQMVNHSELGARIGIDRKTAARYFNLLEQLYIVWQLPAWASNPIKRLVKSPKLHFIDTGLAAHLQGVTDDSVQINRGPIGNLLESFVLSELRKQAGWAQGRYRYSHFRDAEGIEVDLVIEDDRMRVIGIEIKASATVTAKDFSGLRKLKSLSDRFQGGIVLYDGDAPLPFGPNMMAIPVDYLWSSSITSATPPQ